MPGIPLLSQSVLLRGVNDTAAVLSQLFRTLVENRIKPYYLHHLDRAKGTSHFRVPIAEGQDLVRDLRGRISGLCQPTYVLDIPGRARKSADRAGLSLNRQGGWFGSRSGTGAGTDWLIEALLNRHWAM